MNDMNDWRGVKSRFATAARRLFREVFSLRYAIGIDMGGTNIAAGVVDTDGQIIGRARVRTQQFGSPEALCAQLAQVAQLALKNAECGSKTICGIGIGCPAPVNPEAGRLRFCTNLPQLSAYPICETLQSLTGLPIYLGNDADAAAWGEYKAGALRDYPNALAITLGTGVGSGVLLDGQLFHGSGGAGAELGHMVIERNGRPCTCGRRGCWEAYVSKRGLIETTHQVMEAYPNSLLWQMSGGHVGGRLAFDAMRAGDPAGAVAVDAYISDLACGLLNCMNIFQPEAICIGGGLSNEGNFLLGPLQEKMNVSIAGRCGQAPVHLCKAALGNDAGIIGAALLVPVEIGLPVL